jgi:hypothetical protein
VLAFERAMHAAVGRVVTTVWGQVFIAPDLALCYEVNQAWAIGDAGGASAAVIDRDVERLLGSARLSHRQISVEEPAATRLSPGLSALGYATSHHLYLAHEGAAPPAPAPEVHVVEVDVALIADGYDRYLRTDPETPHARDGLVRTQLIEYHRMFGAAGVARERCYAVLDDGEAVAWAKLWSAGRLAQVEDVICLAEYRGHGYGRGVVAGATRAALADGAELVAIVADDDDWPKELYRRLGYVPIGRKRVFARHAPGFALRGRRR